MPDEVDEELERHGHCFAGYADDANVHVRRVRVAERVMALLRRCHARLHLAVKESKSAVASVLGRKCLGDSLWVAPGGEVKRKVAGRALGTFKQRIPELIGRSGGRSMAEVVERLRSCMPGGKGCFNLAQTPKRWRKPDEWRRHRL